MIVCFHVSQMSLSLFLSYPFSAELERTPYAAGTSYIAAGSRVFSVRFFSVRFFTSSMSIEDAALPCHRSS